MPFCWSRIICQKATDDELRCPLRSHEATLDIRSLYSSFLQNASEFLALDALPTNLHLPVGIIRTSKLNKAKERSAL